MSENTSSGNTRYPSAGSISCFLKKNRVYVGVLPNRCISCHLCSVITSTPNSLYNLGIFFYEDLDLWKDCYGPIHESTVIKTQNVDMIIDAMCPLIDENCTKQHRRVFDNACDYLSHHPSLKGLRLDIYQEKISKLIDSFISEMMERDDVTELQLAYRPVFRIYFDPLMVGDTRMLSSARFLDLLGWIVERGKLTDFISYKAFMKDRHSYHEKRFPNFEEFRLLLWFLRERFIIDDYEWNICLDAYQTYIEGLNYPTTFLDLERMKKQLSNSIAEVFSEKLKKGQLSNSHLRRDDKQLLFG
jgi:hypothetical protein